MKHTPLALTGIILFSLLLAACAPNAAPTPESDSSQNYNVPSGAGIPVDDNVYTIRGTVAGDVGSLTRQTEAARGSIAGGPYGTYGSYYGPEFDGKGFVRLLVEESNSELAPVGEIVILKLTDTKGTALLVGDKVTFKCRAQYEAIAAVRNYETWDQEKAALVETWELDYCRLVSPIIDVPATATP